MSVLADYLGLTDDELDELDIELYEDTGSSGEMVYSFWFEVPENISEEIKESTGWEPGQVITGIPINVVNDDKPVEESELDKLLNEIFLPEQSPLNELEKKIEQYRGLVLDHHGTHTATTLKSLLFGAAIGALEAYLWEIVRWKVDNDYEAVNQIIKNCDRYKDVNFTLRHFVSDEFSPKKYIVNDLNNIVWHRIEVIAPIFTKGLEIKLPSLKFFKEAVLTRHHIVHRSGKDTEGRLVEPSLLQTTELFDNVLSFAKDIDKQLYRINIKGMATNVWI